MAARLDCALCLCPAVRFYIPDNLAVATAKRAVLLTPYFKDDMQ